MTVISASPRPVRVNETPPVSVHKLSSTDAFVVVDLDAATTSIGVARLAAKVLQDGAKLLARSGTYAFASFGVAGHGGASAGINATPEGRDQALKAFVEEVEPLVSSGRLVLTPGLGLTATDLAPLVAPGAAAASSDAATDAGTQVDTTAGAVAHRGAPHPGIDPAHDAALTAAGALAAAKVSGPLDWRTAAVVGSGPVADAATSLLAEAGARLADPRFDAACDVLFVAGKPGILDHPTAEIVQATTIVPLSPVPVTARALAVLGRSGRVVIPDFVSTAAPLLAAHDPGGGDPVQRIRDLTIELGEHGTGLWLAAAQRAEEQLATWTDERPFGRPLA